MSLLNRFAVLLFCLVAVGALVPSNGSAADLDTIIALGSDGFAEKVAAIEAVASQGGENAIPVLEAFLEGNLYVVKADLKTVIAREEGTAFILIDPVTLDEIGQVDSDAIRKIRTNNRLRGIIRGAIGGLQLFSSDRGERIVAAEAVFKSRKIEMIPRLELALAREEDERARTQLELALAATQLTVSGNKALQLAAIETLSGHTSQDIRSLLAAKISNTSDNEVRDSAQLAVEEIEARLAFRGNIANIFRGVSLGSVLLLAAVGLAITFGVMGVINMAHGELIMIGAYTTFVVQDLFRSYLPDWFGYSLFVAVPAAFMVGGLIGILIERFMIRFLYGRPLETLLATWGLSLILQQAVRTIFGPTNREVGNPSWMSGSLEVAGGLALTYNRIYIILFSILVVGLLALLMRKTSFGLQMRAVTQNRRMAGSMGIRSGRVDALTFGLGSAIAGIAGVALSQIDNVSPNLGQAYIIDSFLVVVLGGVGNLWGTVVGALTLGMTNKFLEPYAGAVLAKIFVLVAIILFIQKRPRGMFALKGRAVEG